MIIIDTLPFGGVLCIVGMGFMVFTLPKFPIPHTAFRVGN